MEEYTRKKKSPIPAFEWATETANRKENRPPVVETGGRYTERDAQQAQSIPLHHVTTDGRQAQGMIESLLHRGAENGIKTAELLRIMGLSEPRTIRRLISDERAAGAVILSGDTGYYLPDDGEKGRRETEAFIATVTAKGINTIRAVKSARAYLDKLPGQLEIGGGANG